MSAEHVLGKQLWELIQKYMMGGGHSEFVYGLLHNLQSAINAPAQLQARRSAEMLLEAQSAGIQKELDAQYPRNPVG